MPLLALDTAVKPAGVAISDKGAILAEMHLAVKQTPSRQLLSGIEFLLQKCGLEMDGLDGLAVTLGPGFFTGLRIGLATAQGLALGLELPCVGLSTLRVLAEGVKCVQGDIWAVADARRGLVYAARFASDGNRLERMSPDAAMSIERLAREVSGPCLLVGDGAALCMNRLDSAGSRLAPDWAAIPRAGLLALCAEERLAAGQGVKPEELKPRYLRPSDAEIRFGLPMDGYRLLD